MPPATVAAPVPPIHRKQYPLRGKFTPRRRHKTQSSICQRRKRGFSFQKMAAVSSGFSWIQVDCQSKGSCAARSKPGVWSWLPVMHPEQADFPPAQPQREFELVLRLVDLGRDAIAGVQRALHPSDIRRRMISRKVYSTFRASHVGP